MASTSSTRVSKPAIAVTTLLTAVLASSQDDACAGMPDYVLCSSFDPSGDNDPATLAFCIDEVCVVYDMCADIVCTPQDQCHEAGVCNSDNGLCSNPEKADFTSCDDNDPSTTYDVCMKGVCVGNTEEVDTLRPTMEPTQEPTLDPTNSPTPDPCDGVVCSALSQCHEAGVCDSATGLCSNPFKMLGTSCDDGNPVTQLDHCDGSGTCQGMDFCAGVSCTPLDQCHDAGVCNPKNGLCSTPDKENFAPCDDNDPSTDFDVCMNGVCVGNTSPVDTLIPTMEPTEEPTADPTAQPTALPTVDPTADPTSEPTAQPTQDPAAEPTAEPTSVPTSSPTDPELADPNKESGSSMNIGVIAGAAGFVALVVALVAWVYCVKKKASDMKKPGLEWTVSHSGEEDYQRDNFPSSIKDLRPAPTRLTNAEEYRPIDVEGQDTTRTAGESPSVKHIRSEILRPLETGRMETGRDPLDFISQPQPGWVEVRDGIEKALSPKARNPGPTNV